MKAIIVLVLSVLTNKDDYNWIFIVFGVLYILHRGKQQTAARVQPIDTLILHVSYSMYHNISIIPPSIFVNNNPLAVYQAAAV